MPALEPQQSDASDLPELDDLLTTKPSATEPEGSDPDDLPALDDLLAESTEQSKLERAVKEAKERRKRGGGLSSEDLARLAKWESKHEWRDSGNTALFEKTHCQGCGRNQTVFSQLMRRHEHRHLRATERWVVATAVDPKLPNEVAVRKFIVGMCTNCCHQAGFVFQNVKEWEG